MSLVLGLGPGLFTLIVLWSIAVLVCVVFLHARRAVAVSILAGTALLTLVLKSIPISAAEHHYEETDQVLDPLYVWRLVLVTLMALSAIAGAAMVVVLHYNQPLLAKPMRHFGPL